MAATVAAHAGVGSLAARSRFDPRAMSPEWSGGVGERARDGAPRTEQGARGETRKGSAAGRGTTRWNPVDVIRRR